MKYFNITRRILLVGVLTLTFGSCTDDFETPEPLTGKSIAAMMEADANFTLWTAMVKRVGMYPSLNDPNSGVVTIFGPADPAVTSYLSATYSAQLTLPITESSLVAFIDGLSTTSNPTLASFVTTVVPVLNYHIVSSKLTATELTGNQTFATLNGARLSISVLNAVILLNGNTGANGATVTNVDLLGSNGVAHTIDRVMAVPGVATVLTPLELSISYATNPPTITKTNPEFDATDTDFDLLAAMLRYTGQVPTILPNATPLPEFTIFRVTDGVMRAYLNTINAALITEADCGAYILSLVSATPPPTPNPTLADLTALAQYHVVPGRYLVQDFSDNQVLTTLLTGKDLTVGVVTGPPAVYTIKDLNAAADPTVSASNSLTNSGVLHTVSGVLRSN